MRITDLLKSESIALGQKPADKQSAIRQLADLMAASGNLSDKEQYLNDVFAREAAARRASATASRRRMPRARASKKPASPP